jgi:conjugal transfer/entry exclusion protein
MSDEELVKRLREEAITLSGIGINCGSVDASLSALLAEEAADRIEALTAERDDHWKSFVHWRKEADGLTEQLEAARSDAKEAEAYAEELERDLKTCRMAQAVIEEEMG